MTQTTPFDSEHPYRLSESEHDSLCTVRSTLAVLASLCGQAGGAADHKELDFTAHELHETLWGLHRGVEATLKAIHQRDNQRSAA